LGLFALIAVSAGFGLLTGSRVGPSIRRALLTVGFVALALGLLVVAFTIIGWGPLGVWTGGLAAALLLVLAAAVLPFAVAIRSGRT
jgi:hypothetical protein